MWQVVHLPTTSVWPATQSSHYSAYTIFSARSILPHNAWPENNSTRTQCRAGRQQQGFGVDNVELLIGDVVGLTSFCLYKQIAAIALSPTFPGWVAPLHFNPIRFAEFGSFWLTLTGIWVSAGAVAGGIYRADAASSLPVALSRTCITWLAAMPVAAAQLVLLTAAEDRALVGTEGWATVLPLAAQGPGEPFVTAAGVLGLMAAWRAFYAAYLDTTKFLSLDGARLDREADAQHFKEALAAALGLGVACSLVLHVLSSVLGPL